MAQEYMENSVKTKQYTTTAGQKNQKKKYWLGSFNNIVDAENFMNNNADDYMVLYINPTQGVGSSTNILVCLERKR